MPPADLQARFVGSSGRESFREAEAFWRRVLAGVHLGPGARVLDLGVGWGRLYRWALRDFPISDLVGADVDPAMVDLCRAAMPDGDFRLVGAPPYADVPDGGFDLAILYSVFSHLSEAGMLTILVELARLVKPGGHVAFTTLKRAHIPVWERQGREDAFRRRALDLVGFAARPGRRGPIGASTCTSRPAGAIRRAPKRPTARPSSRTAGSPPACRPASA